MKTKTKAEHCPVCGKHAYYYQDKPIKLSYKSYTILINQPGYFCNECGEGLIGGKKATQTELRDFRQEIGFLAVSELVKSRLSK